MKHAIESKFRSTHGFLVLGVVSVLGGMLVLSGCVKKQPLKPVPESLNAIESMAEDMYDIALAGSLSKFKDYAARLQADWTSFKEQETTVLSQDEDTVAGVDAAVSGLKAMASAGSDDLRLARGANAVSAYMFKLFSLYGNAVPPDVMSLDYLGREIVLDGMESDFASAMADYEALAAAWKRLRPRVAGKGAEETAKAYDQTLEGILKGIAAKDTAKIISEADTGMDIVDKIEVVFEKNE